MIQYNMFGINLMQLQIFLKCAEYSSFSKAARALHVTDSMVSKRIAALENATGLILFVRKKNRVILTPAGRELYQEWRNLAETFAGSLERAHRVQTAMSKPISFGLGDSTNIDRYFVPLLGAFEENERQVSFKVKLRKNFDMLDALSADVFDIVFAPKFIEEALTAREDLDYFMAVPSSLYAGLSENNPLSRWEKLRMEDLRDVGFIMPNPNTERMYGKWLTKLCERHGYRPKADQYITDGSVAFLSINDHNVFVTDKYYRDFQTKSVVFREIEDTESGILMIWKKNCRPVVARFAAHARLFYRELQR